MFIEAVDSNKRALEQYRERCRDSLSSGIADSLQESIVTMDRLAASCEEAARKMRESQTIGDDIAKRKAAIMSRISRILPSVRAKQNDFGAPLNKKSSVDRQHAGEDRGSALYGGYRQTLGESAFTDQNHANKKEHVMDEKDKEVTNVFLAAFHSMEMIEEELKKASETMALVLKAHNNMSSLSEANRQFELIRVVDSSEIKRIEMRLQTVNRLKEEATSVVAEFDANNHEYYENLTSIVTIKTDLEEARHYLVEFNKVWNGSSKKCKKYIAQIDSALSKCKVKEKELSTIRDSNTALGKEAAAFQSKWALEADTLSQQLNQAKYAKQNRAEILKNIQQYVANISNILSKLSGKDASEFSSSRSIEGGDSMAILAKQINPQAIITAALLPHKQILTDLSSKCRIGQPKLERLVKDDMNLTVVFPQHILYGDAETSVLDGNLSIPYSLRFPFKKSIVFGDVSDIAPFIVRLLYTLPMGKVQISAIDHKSFGENISVLKALYDFNGMLRIVTSIDDVTGLLRELKDLMGERIRNVFSFKENDWMTYNANHPGATLPLLVVPIYSMRSFSAIQLDLLEEIFANGPRFGIICLLANDASEDLEERLHKKFEEMKLDYERVEKDGTPLASYVNLSLKMSSESIPRRKTGELVEIYATEYKEIGKKSVREIKFQSLLDKMDNLWKEETIDGISATIGWDVAGEPVNFEFGQAMSVFHALVGGTTGSGKSVFLHALIQSLAIRYSPDELQFYLLDYKNGDEFKKYADNNGNAWLPHIKMISRHKDPRFALELFDFLDKEFRRRSDQFSQLDNCGDIVTYRKKGGKIPRIIIIIDEFQVMFEEYCGLNLSDEVARRLSTIFKQGRSYGIHLILATQSLKSLHVSGWADMANQIGLRIALKGMEGDGILESGNRAAEKLERGQCIVNHSFGLKDSEEKVNNILTFIPDSDPVRVEACKDVRILIERKAQEMRIKSSCRVFNGTELPHFPGAEAFAESLRSEKWNTFFTLLFGARTDFSSTPFAVDFTEEQREHLLVAGEDGNLSSDSDVRITGEEVWDGLRRDIMRSLQSMRVCEVLYYNPTVGEVPQDVPDYFISLSGRAKEKDLLEAFQKLESSKSEKKIIIVENFQDARLLHPGDAPRTTFSSHQAPPQPETPRSIFSSLFNGTDDPKYHVIIMTKNFGFMNKEVLARSGADTNILRGCNKRVAFNLSEDDLTVMIPHQKVSDRRGPRRVWFEDMRTGTVLDFLPYGK